MSFFSIRVGNKGRKDISTLDRSHAELCVVSVTNCNHTGYNSIPHFLYSQRYYEEGMLEASRSTSQDQPEHISILFSSKYMPCRESCRETDGVESEVIVVSSTEVRNGPGH